MAIKEKNKLIKTSSGGDPFDIYYDEEDGKLRSKETLEGDLPEPEPQLRDPNERIPNNDDMEPEIKKDPEDLIKGRPEKVNIKDWRQKNWTPYLDPTGTIDFDESNPSYNPDVNLDDPPMSPEQADQELVDFVKNNPDSLYDTLLDFYNGYGPGFDEHLPKEFFDIPGAEDIIDQIQQDDEDVTSGRPVIRKADNGRKKKN